MPPENDINSTYNTALNWAKDKLQESEDKFGDDAGGDKITNKLYDVLAAIKKYKIKIERRMYEDYQNDMLFIIYHLGLLTGIISSYLQKENLTKEQMIELNQIYRKYKS